jgi:HEAT repeat protein
MKAQTIAALLLGSMLFGSTPLSSATAADLSQLIADAARWESGQNAEPLRQIEQLARESAGKPAQRAELEAALAKLLAPASTFEARRFACQQLAVVGSDASVPAIAKLLAENETIGIACLAFGNRPSAKADEALRAALPAARGQGRLQIISTLGNRRDTKAVPALTAIARENDPNAAKAAIAALAKIGDTPARKALAELRRTHGAVFGRWFAEADLRMADHLTKSGNHKSAAAIYETLLDPAQPAFVRRGAFVALVRCERDDGEKRILQTLRGSDSVLKPAAIAAVRNLPSKSASETFGRELPGLSAEAQVWLIDSLAVRNDDAARSAITTALASSSDTGVCQAAAQALGRIGDARSAKPLAKALVTAKDDTEANTIEGALVALPGGRDTENAILAEMRASQGKTRARLISSLAARRSPEVITALLNETENPDPVVAKAAYRVLAKAATADTLPALLAKFVTIRDTNRRADAETFVEQAVGIVEKPAARSAAVCGALQRAPNLETRLALLRLLPACGDATALAALIATSKDTDKTVRDAAVNALAEWPDATAWDTLALIYRQPEDEPQRAAALRGLARLSGEETNSSTHSRVAEFAVALLQDAHSDADLKLVLGALGGAKQAEVLQFVLPLLDKPAVRAEAEAAVRRIAAAIKDRNPEAAKTALEKLAK